MAEARAEGLLKLSAKSMNIRSGHFKLSLFYTSRVWAELTAYCVGDQKAIMALLETCGQIGGRRGVGFGRVAEITVESIPAQDCLWQHRYLPLSADCADTHAKAYGALKAPYWDRREHQEILVPIT